MEIQLLIEAVALWCITGLSDIMFVVVNSCCCLFVCVNCTIAGWDIFQFNCAALACMLTVVGDLGEAVDAFTTD